MIRERYRMASLIALAVMGSASNVRAQSAANQTFYGDMSALQLKRVETPVAASPSAPPAAASDAGPDFVQGWPRPVEIPESLFRQAPAQPQYGCAPLPGRYFEPDPLLDPPNFPQPGFVASVEVQAVGPHIFQQLSNGVPVGGNAPGSLTVPITSLNWTVSPKVEVGYRLASGFGEFAINWQYIGTTGSGSTPFGPGGAPANQSGRFNFNLSDLDYVSREYTPWEHWGMQWRVGFRQVYLFYDTTLTAPSAATAATTGVLQQAGTNGYQGWGGHIGVELDRDLYSHVPGLSLVAKLDFGDTAGFVQQKVSQTTLAGYSFGDVQQGQAVPELAAQLGLNYRQPGGRYEFFVGGFYQYWWNVGTLPNFGLNVSGAPRSGGELSLTGVTARFSYNY